jgi:hypothetical protein
MPYLSKISVKHYRFLLDIIEWKRFFVNKEETSLISIFNRICIPIILLKLKTKEGRINNILLISQKSE